MHTLNDCYHKTLTSPLACVAFSLAALLVGCGGQIGGDANGNSLALTGATGVRRLTVSEYNYTVRDLLGTTLTPADQFPDDPIIGGFDNNAIGLSVSSTLADFYQKAAKQLADEITGATNQSSKVLTCDINQADCLPKIVMNLASRAWRRPVSAEEAQSIISGSKPADTQTLPAGDALNLAVRAILTSPNFVFRLELGSNKGRLDNYELASRLSYFLWSSIPDDQLMAAAQSGKLGNADELRAQTLRMLNDPKANALIDNFAAQWLGLKALLKHQVDTGTYKSYDNTLRDSMIQETKLYFGEFLKNNLNMNTFLTANFTFVNNTLATHYGLQASGSDFKKITVDGDQRGGFLRQASFLTLGSLSNRSSPIFRGKRVLLDLLCVNLPAPPNNVPSLPKVPDGDATIRDKLAEHRANPACAGCHNLMDPIGLGFEKYNGVGGFITDANVDVSGTLDSGQSFTTVSDLVQKLTNDPRYTRCVPTKMFSYALGRKVEEKDAATIDALTEGYKAKGMGLRDLILDIVTHSTFQQGKGG